MVAVAFQWQRLVQLLLGLLLVSNVTIHYNITLSVYSLWHYCLEGCSHLSLDHGIVCGCCWMVAGGPVTVTMHLCCPLLVSNVTIHYISLCVFDITVSRAALTLASIMALSVWLLLDGGWRSSDSDNASILPLVGVKCDNTLLYQFTPFDITVSRAALTLASIMALSVWLLLGGGWRSSDSDNASVLPFNREDSCRERGRTKPHVQCLASI